MLRPSSINYLESMACNYRLGNVNTETTSCTAERAHSIRISGRPSQRLKPAARSEVARAETHTLSTKDANIRAGDPQCYDASGELEDPAPSPSSSEYFPEDIPREDDMT